MCGKKTHVIKQFDKKQTFLQVLQLMNARLVCEINQNLTVYVHSCGLSVIITEYIQRLHSKIRLHITCELF